MLKDSIVNFVLPELRALSQTGSPTIFPNVGVRLNRTATPVSSYKPLANIRSLRIEDRKMYLVVKIIRNGFVNDLFINRTG